MDINTAWKIVGGLSKPSKMPWYSYSIPAEMCKIGAKLAKIPGSVCHSCYALKGRYRMPNVRDVQRIRFASLSHPMWVEAMAFLLNNLGSRKPKYFRWHDAGDLQSPAHLDLILEVCRRTPSVKHWLPTREHAIVKTRSDFPPNLTIRISSHHVDSPPVKATHTSTVVTQGASCPAYTQDGKCGACRACWDPSIPNVSYPLH